MSQRYVDLSSDDDGRREADAKRKAYKRRSLGGPIYSREHFMGEIMAYTDEELFQQLKRYNFDCGPISGSTRKVYQKKLAEKMVEGPPPPPPKMQRRSMGPTIRSLPTKLPEPEPEDDMISGSSGSDIEIQDFEPDYHQKPRIQEDNTQVVQNSKSHKKNVCPDLSYETLLPSIQLKRIEKDRRPTPPPEESNKHPLKIQPMHKERVKPRPKSNTSTGTASKDDVSIWVQIIILLICLFVTVFFLTYIQSAETLPNPSDLTDVPPVVVDTEPLVDPIPIPVGQNDTQSPTPSPEDIPPIEQDIIPIEQDSIPIEQDFIPIEQDSIPIEQDFIPIEQDSIPIEQDSIPIEQDSIPIEQDSIPIEPESSPLEPESDLPIDSNSDKKSKSKKKSSSSKKDKASKKESTR